MSKKSKQNETRNFLMMMN